MLEAFTTAERDRTCVIEGFGDDVKPELYAACDVFASSSGRESFGITFLEAWAAGKPVIRMPQRGSPFGGRRVA